MGDKVSAVTFIIVRPDGTILMQKRDDGRGKKIAYPNKWCFPGGTKEEREDYIDCVIREAEEEYNLKLKKTDCRLIHIYNHDDIENDNVFLCRIDQNQEPALEEGAGMKWMDINEIEKLGSELAWVQNEIIPRLEKSLSQ
ncbi:MAG: NUDIX hydrolase [Candidatus Sungbacteria bacterium]|uniref:NUDIX hydrolase n=1 Tax=Candidatus Sungiibacteriota bacterium TaxID=2750080 RepID=A0A933DTI9_9BACT|nr:NUDIX hydrolase [Candidatus Sungbacteria bacterium]